MNFLKLGLAKLEKGEYNTSIEKKWPLTLAASGIPAKIYSKEKEYYEEVFGSYFGSRDGSQPGGLRQRPRR